MDSGVLRMLISLDSGSFVPGQTRYRAPFAPREASLRLNREKNTHIHTLYLDYPQKAPRQIPRLTRSDYEYHNKVTQKIVLDSLSTSRGAFLTPKTTRILSNAIPVPESTSSAILATGPTIPTAKASSGCKEMAGTGKSTVSRTVFHKFDDKEELRASFFFKRGGGDRGKATLFFTTIAVQLVQHLPHLTRHVRKAIEAETSIAEKKMEEQMERLILDPLKEIEGDPNTSKTIMVVVECP
jgi:hypothetical protein